MKTLRKSSHLIHCLWLLAVTLLMAACNSEDGDSDGANPAAANEQATGLVAMPARGRYTETGRFLDLSINGDGMFVLDDTRRGEQVYARYGRFDMDRSGALIDTEGRRLMGQLAAPAASASAAAGSAPVATVLPPIQLLLTPRATSRLQFQGNLDSRVAGVDWSLAFNPQDDRTYNHATSATVYDAKGQGLQLILYFRKSDSTPDSWEVYMTANGQPSPYDGVPLVSYLQFMPDGSRLSYPTGQLPITIPEGLTLTSGGSSMQIDLMLDLSAATQYGSSFVIFDLSQDGYAAGMFAGMNISPRGFITASYANGQTRAVGQVLLAKFTAADRFGLAGEHAYSCKRSCAQPRVDVPGLLPLGNLLAGSLEVE